MKNTIYKYIFFEFLRYFSISLFALAIIVWTIQSVNFLDLVTEDGHSFGTFFNYSILTLSKVFTKLIPFCFLLTLVLTISKLEKDNEIIAIWTAGLNKIYIVNLIFRISLTIMFLQLLLTIIINPTLLNISRDIIKKVKDRNIKMFDFIDNMEHAYSASDLVISRAGATAISEILYLGIPSILIPYPFAANNHQEINAKVLDNIEAAVMVKESEFENNVLENKIFEIIDSNHRRNLLKKNALEFSNRDSSFLIKEKIKEMILDAR